MSRRNCRWGKGRRACALACGASISLLTITRNALAQVNFTSTYDQDFNTLPTSTTLWSNNGTLAGWYIVSAQDASQNTTRDTTSPTAWVNNIQADNGQSNGSNPRSYGTSGNSDRALGGLNNAHGDYSFTLVLRNTSGATINNLAMSYTGEQWYANITSQQALDFDYRVFSSDPTAAVTTNLAPGSSGYTDPSSNQFDFYSPTNTEDHGLNGNLPANQVGFSGLLSSGLNWQNNQYLVLRWWDNNDVGRDHGLAIDDLLVDSVTTQYWSPNGSAGGSGAWENTILNFNTRSTYDGVAIAYSSAQKVIFSGTGGAVTPFVNVNVNAGMQFDVTGYSIASGASALVLGANSPVTVTTAGHTATISALVLGTNGLTKAGAGQLVVDNTNNSYSGGTTVNAGTLSVPQVYVLGSKNSDITLSGGALLITASTQTGNSTHTFNVGAADGTIDVSSNVIAKFGSSGTSTLRLANHTLTKMGAGTFTFTSAADTTGGGSNDRVNVANGTLKIGATNALPPTVILSVGDSINATNGVFDLNGVNQTVTQLTNTTTGSSITNSSSAADSVLTVTGTSTYSAQLNSGASKKLSLIKSTGGVLTLSGTNGYTGTTTVSGGRLNVTGTHAGAFGAYTVGTGAALGGSGTINPSNNATLVTVNAGGKLAPGTSVGKLTVDGSFTLANDPTAVLEIEVSGSNASTSNYDILEIKGASSTLSVNGARLNVIQAGINITVTASATFDAPKAYKIVNVNTSASYNGDAFANLNGQTSASIYSDSTMQYRVFYNPTAINEGIYIQFNYVPEPSSGMLIGLGALRLLRRRRR